MSARLSILGSTGSIGESTLEVVRQQRARFTIEGLTAHNNLPLLINQAREFTPKAVAIGNAAHYNELKDALSDLPIEVSAGDDAVCEIASRPADKVMAAIVGAAGLKPVMAAIHHGADIALANKECLVCGGSLVIEACRASGSQLLPVDSEHNAIFQVFPFDQPDQVDSIILTASGGPFREFSAKQLASVTPAQAIKHPNWDMGAKISVDSATMMNKGLEMIEAYYLFPLKPEQIQVLVHPESVIHSLVQLRDGSVLAQLGLPDMKTPIAVSLNWPERVALNLPKLNLAETACLNFYEPDLQRFPALSLARQSLMEGQAAQIIFNAANEVAVSRFLAGQIKFNAIAGIVEDCLEHSARYPISSIDDIIACDEAARHMAMGSQCAA